MGEKHGTGWEYGKVRRENGLETARRQTGGTKGNTEFTFETDKQIRDCEATET